ncbi:response regulator transcription factor [Bacillus alkalicellulosilyticus]|uniref:response regulator transcription factor n=1 Tax=Alkalihalobacterium alkalicellulosilyticum TaxID=1912214 RepID=UPI00099665BF|nr:response regulator [Bacillus alkalicellulosilyticus]
MTSKEIPILICDDSRLIREQLKAILQSLGYDSILEAENGEEAISICASGQPSLVFLDIVMPIKDGITALTEMIDKHEDIKVVMISSTTSLAHLKKAKRLGAFDFIHKPIEVSTIEKVMTKFESNIEKALP